MLFDNLAKGNFHGPLYPINRTARDIMGKTAYPTLAEVPEKVDLVYIVLPQQYVEDAIKQCVAAGARSACIITAGFSEASPKGRVDEDRLREIARTSGLLLAGPNTIGMVNAEVGMMGSFVNFPRWENGGVSFFTQTGIFTGAVMLHVMTGATQRLPVGKSIDVGNKIDVDELDFLHYVADDPATKVIGFYIESIRNPRAFFDKAREVRKTKPIVVLKPGRTREGAKASASHTGSLASDNDILDGALRQYGIARAEDEDDFLNALRALVMLPRPRGQRVGRRHDKRRARRDLNRSAGRERPRTRDLRARDAGTPCARSCPTGSSRPIRSISGSASTSRDRARRTKSASRRVRRSRTSIWCLCTLLAPGNADFPEFGELLRRLRQTYDKPVAVVIYGGEAGQRWTADCEGANMPIFKTTRAGVRALALMVEATAPI